MPDKPAASHICLKYSINMLLHSLLAMFFLGLVLAKPATSQEAVLRVGTEGAYAPFNYFENGKLVGFDTEIATALCAEMKMTCAFVPTDWDNIINNLQAGEYDVIIASLSITEERKKQVLFTDKYYSNAIRFVGQKGAVESNSTNPLDMKSKRIGAQKGSLAESHLLKKYARSARIRTYDNQEEAFRDLAGRKLDYVIVDALPAYDWLQSLDGQCCQFSSPPIYADEGIGMAVNLNNTALRDQLNTALATILQNGVYQQINARYFPFSIY